MRGVMRKWSAMPLAALMVLTWVNFACARGTRPAAIDEISRPAGPRNWAELWRTWGFEAVVAPMLLSAILYGMGVWRTWKTAGIGHGISRLEALYFSSGWLALAVGLVSSLHPWGNVLFSVHMVGLPPVTLE